MQKNAPIRIRPRDDGRSRAHPDSDPQLLVELAGQARLERLTGLALPSGELPEPPEMFRRVALRHEEASRALDDRRAHLHHGEAGARGQLSEEREERGAVGGPHTGVSARVRRVEEDHHLPPARLVALSVVARQTHGLIQHRARGDGAHGHHDLRAERLELGREERLASASLARERAAVSAAAAPADPGRGPALDGVGQVEEVLEVEPETPDLPSQEHPSGAGPLSPLLDAGDSRGLADEGEPGVSPAEGARRELPPVVDGGARAARGDPADRRRERGSRQPGGPLGRSLAPRQLASQGYARQKRRIGQGRQSGFLAVHQVAPKSMRAWLKSYTRARGRIRSASAQRAAVETRRPS